MPTQQFRIPITSITVLGTSFLLAISVGIVLYLGFNQAAQTTQQLSAENSRTLIQSAIPPANLSAYSHKSCRLMICRANS